MSTVSVIIPTWNRATTIEKAIHSALNQTFPPLEVLVCDDGSTDETEHIVKSICDERVRWIAGPRRGRPAIPRNRGIMESKAEWLAFLDSDDEWLPTKLESQLSVARKLNCQAVCTNAYRYVRGVQEKGNVLAWEHEKVTFDDLLDINYVICSSVILHRSLFDTVGGFPEDANLKSVEDYALWLRVTTKTDFAFIKKAFLVYRDDPEHSIRKEGTDDWSQRKEVFQNFKAWGKKVSLQKTYFKKINNKFSIALMSRLKNACLQKINKCFIFLKSNCPNKN